MWSRSRRGDVCSALKMFPVAAALMRQAARQALRRISARQRHTLVAHAMHLLLIFSDAAAAGTDVELSSKDVTPNDPLRNTIEVGGTAECAARCCEAFLGTRVCGCVVYTFLGTGRN